MEDIKATLIAGLACDLPVHMLVDELEQIVQSRCHEERERCAIVAERFNAAGKPIADEIRRAPK